VDPGVIRRAAGYLDAQLRTGDPQTLSGPEYYNHLLTLNTLLELQNRAPDPERRALVERALTHLVRQQQPDGGWGYAEEQPLSYGRLHRPSSNSAVTWWVCHLLEKHRGVRIPGGERALAAGQDWLAARLESPDAIAYQVDGPAARSDDALFWMAARDVASLETRGKMDVHTPDAYRDVFRTRALQATRALKDVYAGQNRDGAWDRPDDRWWKAGGRIYVTAASVLSLVPQGGV
jgi:hypothetical protein